MLHGLGMEFGRESHLQHLVRCHQIPYQQFTLLHRSIGLASAFQGYPLAPETLRNARGMGNLPDHFLGIVGIRGKVLLRWDVHRVGAAVVVCETRAVLADRHKTVFHLLQELVELHPHSLVVHGLVRALAGSGKLLHLLFVVLLVYMRHRRLVDVEDGIDILTRVGLVLLAGVLVEGKISLAADLVVGIVVVDILVGIRPHHRHAFLTLTDSLAAFVGLTEHRIDVGLEPAQVAVHRHHQGIARRQAQGLVVKTRSRFA